MDDKIVRCHLCGEKHSEVQIFMGACPSDYCVRMRVRRWKYLSRKNGRLQTKNPDPPKLWLVK